MRTFIVGDIHGHYTEFAELLMLLICDHEMDLEVDKIVFMGDYIDRGPDSNLVVEAIMKLEEQYGKDNVIPLKGNHEDMCVHHGKFPKDWDLRKAMNFIPNGGYETLKSFGGEIPNDVYEWMYNLRLTYETDTHFFAHAGVNPDFPLNEQKEWDLLWIRGEFHNSDKDFGKIVVFGHTPVQCVQTLSNKIAMDTGVAYGKYLSAYILEEDKVVKVEAVPARLDFGEED